MITAPTIVWLSDADLHETSNIGTAGKKVANLVQAGFPLLPGFIITQDAYFAFLQQNKLEDKIRKLLTTVNYDRPESMHQVMQHIKKHIKSTSPSDNFIKQLSSFYAQLEDIPLALHAHATIPGSHKVISQRIEDFDGLVESIIVAWEQHFEPNMHWKRHKHGHDHLTSGIEIIVQVDIKPQSHGRILTIDPHEHAKNVVHVTHDHQHASDKYVLSKKNLMIIDRHLTHHNQARKLDSETILQLAILGKELERHLYFPQEVSWGMFGDTVYILHTKPISTLPKSKSEKKKKLAHTRGVPLTHTIGSGVVRIIENEKDLEKILVHDIVVVNTIDKAHVQHIKKARGVISEKGEKHSEVATLLRQLGIPAIYGVKDAKKRFKNGYVITIHGRKGEIYSGGFH